MPRTTLTVSRARFIADESSITRNGGRQINWAAVTATNEAGQKIVPAGTVVGDLAGAGLIGPRVLTTNPAIGILETDAVQGSKTASASGYSVIIGGAIYEAFLPEASGNPRILSGAIKTELINADGTTGFGWQKYEDAR